MVKLSGRVALVTASTEGIGLAIARKLGQEGAHVVICSRKKKNVDAAIAELKSEHIAVSGMPCHVGKPEDRKALLKKIKEDHGELDIVVSNAAANPYFGNILGTSESVFDKIMDVNVKSHFMLIQEAVPLMSKEGRGSIVIISSIAGYQPNELLGVYGISKTGLLGMTKALTNELASMNIRVNCIAPGLIETKFSKAILSGAARSEVLSPIPLKRPGKPEECAGIVSFLCSDEASYITGETIVVGGGIASRL